MIPFSKPIKDRTKKTCKMHVYRFVWAGCDFWSTDRVLLGENVYQSFHLHLGILAACNIQEKRVLIVLWYCIRPIFCGIDVAHNFCHIAQQLSHATIGICLATIVIWCKLSRNILRHLFGYRIVCIFSLALHTSVALIYMEENFTYRRIFDVVTT